MCPVQCKAVVSVNITEGDTSIYKPKKCLLFANKPDWRTTPTAVSFEDKKPEYSDCQHFISDCACGLHPNLIPEKDCEHCRFWNVKPWTETGDRTEINQGTSV